MMTKKKVNEPENQEEKSNTHASENNINNQPVTDNNEALKELPTEEPPAGQAEGETPASDREGDKVAVEMKNMEEKLAELQDKYLRLSAEFDNYRKRTLKEKMEISRYAGEELLKDMLPIADDFDRAIRHMEGSTDCKGLKEGIDLISFKFTEFLRQNGIKEIESLNSEFNVDLHDAVAKVHVADENQKGRVVEILQKGYYLKDKVIRHSKVVIGE